MTRTCVGSHSDHMSGGGGDAGDTAVSQRPQAETAF